MSEQILFTEYKLGNLSLKNRIVMAPMTRSRAGKGNTATDLMAEYYKQRSGAGLIISEGSQVSPIAVGYRNTPGIYNSEQIDSWKKVTEKVHNNNSLIFLQLWHVGRISHPDFHDGNKPIAPSAIKPKGRIMTYTGPKEMETPREMTIDDIKNTIEQFAKGAENAITAGFDGVEIHGANNYLLQQFLCDGSNQRTDEYGGELENRAKFPLEIVDAVTSTIGSDRVGYKLSPSNYHYGTTDSSPIETFDFLVDNLNKYNLAYLHLQEPFVSQDEILPGYLKYVTKYYRKRFEGSIITNVRYTRETANEAVKTGLADLVSFGIPFISNPDLPERFHLGAELAQADRNTFYDGGEKGYTDYPFLQ